MNNFSSYGENSGFSAITAEELERVNGGASKDVSGGATLTLTPQKASITWHK